MDTSASNLSIISDRAILAINVWRLGSLDAIYAHIVEKDKKVFMVNLKHYQAQMKVAAPISSEINVA